MRKLLFLPCLMIFTALYVSAQNQPSADFFWNLVQKNAQAIGLNASDLKNVRISDAYYDNQSKAYMVYLQQTYRSIDVENVVYALAFKEDRLLTGKFIKNSAIETAAKNINVKVNLNAVNAMLKAASVTGSTNNKFSVPLKQSADAQHLIFEKFDGLLNNIYVDLKWVSTDDNNSSFKLSWNVFMHTVRDNAAWLISVDAASGQIIKQKNLTVYETNGEVNHPHQLYVYEDNDAEQSVAPDKVDDIKSISSANYSVIPYPVESPVLKAGVPTLVSNPWTAFPNTNATTLKWNSDGTTDYATSKGNNVLTSTDLQNKNNESGTMAQSSTPVPNLNFRDTVNYSEPTISDSNQQFALTNLFYWNNIVHDMSYQYGFDELSGNFQVNNLLRGGLGNDNVFADAQDGYSMDNSNFATPPDGSNPRMQMFLWSRPYYWPTLTGNSPQSFSGYIPAWSSVLSNLAEKPDITNNVVYYNNSTSGHNGCVAASNASQLNGKIAFVDRGTCNFSVKVENAQAAGAIAVIVGDTVPSIHSSLVQMVYKTRTDGSFIFDQNIKIPSVFIPTSNANTLRTLLNTNQTVNVTLSSINIDGSLDNAIIAHEYTHGISNRLTGGPSNVNCLNNIEQGGEGMSDFDALMLTTNWKTALLTDGSKPRTIGNYVFGLDSAGPGIRTYPYSTDMSINPWTYDSLTTLASAEPHLIGEIWCEMLWEMNWSIIQQVGSINTNFANASGTGGNSIAMHLFIEGLKLQPCSPTFLEGRNAILQADTLLYGGTYSPAIWKAFAKRGLGYSADQGNPNVLKDNKSAYDLPPNVLAAIFGNFTAQKQGNTALLKWSTAQESNTSRFIVERTTDARNFIAIGEVKAAGNSVVTQNYQFTDANPVEGDNMYRIKEVDNDGKYSMSVLRSLNFGDYRPSISISPNPATNIVTINIPGNDQALHVKLFSNAGQSINNYIMNNETLSIDVSRLASGVYNIVIEGTGYSSKYKLVVR
jgi:hypothetical protein